MKRLNSKGFGLPSVLIAILILVVIGGAGAYVYHRDHKTHTITVSTSQNATNTSSKAIIPTLISTSAATQLIKSFYNQYVALEKDVPPQATQASQLVQQEGTANLVKYVTPPAGYSYYENAVVCAQALPDNISVSNVTSTTANANGTVTETFGNNLVKVVVGVVKQSGSLKVNSITCNPPLTPQKGGQ